MDVFHWLIGHGYSLMLLFMLIEGPVITAGGAFAAKLGYFNFYFVFLLSIAGNFIPDILYYAIGYWGGVKFVNRFGKYFKLDHAKIISLESLMNNHAWKTLFVVKMIPFMAVPGLIAAGLVKMPLKKYITLSLAIILPTSLLFFAVGYYGGVAYKDMVDKVNNAFYLLIVVLAIFIAISYTWKMIQAKIANIIERI